MADRRRVVGPADGTTAPVYTQPLSTPHLPSKRPRRDRAPDELRTIFLKTSLTPPATGSSFLELPSPPPIPPQSTASTAITTPSSTLKLTCSVYGPRPLPPSAPFSPQARLQCELKFAPFATPHKRRGYVRDSTERDLSVDLTSALQRSILLEKYPKSGIEVFVTVLDCEGDAGSLFNASGYVRRTMGGGGGGGDQGVDVGLLGVLAGAITCASAAIADAGIECLDLVSGGVSALVRKSSLSSSTTTSNNELVIVQDPSPEEHGPGDIIAACAVGHMAARGELTDLWTRGVCIASIGNDGEEDGEDDELDKLMKNAIEAATQTRKVLNAAVAERLLFALSAAKQGKDEMEMT
ncbi:3' exoribonuclease family, domain 1-domain-containing protein [Kalaharituber pfeilii]|nr:3' exoribonuclease family, domain 1-domain-containing protein [Kalaharituber pfeilii]